MRAPIPTASALALLVACRSDPSAPNTRRPAPRPAPSVADAAPATPAVPPTRTTAPDGDATTQGGSSDDGVRAFRVADSACVRDPARNALGIGVHGYFGDGRLEVEVRNVRYSCTPPPVYVAAFEAGTVYLRVSAPDRAALGRCQCRHDQFLQITGIPRGEYAVVVEELAADDAGTPTRLGRGTIVANAGATAAPATDNDAGTSSATSQPLSGATSE